MAHVGYHLKIRKSLIDAGPSSQARRLLDGISRVSGETQLKSISHEGHETGSDEVSTYLLVRLKSSSWTQSLDRDESLLCRLANAMLHPAADEILLTVSELGILGISPAADDSVFSRCWNQVLLKMTYLEGVEAFSGAQKRALSLTDHRFLPPWHRMVNFAVQFGLMAYFSINPALHNYDKVAIEATIKARETAIARKEMAQGLAVSVVDYIPLNIICKIAKKNSQRPEKIIKQDAKEAMKHLFTAIAHVSDTLTEIRRKTDVSLSSQNILFNHLVVLATRVSSAYTANEELLGYYITFATKHAGDGFESSFFGCWRAVEALQFINARNLVAPEGWLKQAGRSLGFVTGPTPSQMKSFFGWKAAGLGGAAAYSLVSAAWSISKALQNKRQADCCVEVGWLVEQTLAQSAEMSTFIRWINCSGQTFSFKNGKEKDWEKTLTVKTGSAPPKEAVTADFLIKYLDTQAKTLQETRENLRNELLEIVWSNVN